jgi:hypothetical protein
MEVTETELHPSSMNKDGFSQSKTLKPLVFVSLTQFSYGLPEAAAPFPLSPLSHFLYTHSSFTFLPCFLIRNCIIAPPPQTMLYSPTGLIRTLSQYSSLSYLSARLQILHTWYHIPEDHNLNIHSCENSWSILILYITIKLISPNKL